MGNLGKTPFMTLHIYGAYEYEGSSTDDALVFELEKDQISITSGSAFINMTPKQRKSVVSGIQTDKDTYHDYLACIRPFYARLGQCV
jgi:hypothetical protein